MSGKLWEKNLRDGERQGERWPQPGRRERKLPEEPDAVTQDKRPCLLGCVTDRERSWRGQAILLSENLA